MAKESKQGVFITGASGGIGGAAARTLARRGYRVYAGMRSTSKAPSFDADIDLIEVDVTEPESVQAAAQEVTARQGRAGLRAVINNAGIIIQGPLELVPTSDLVRQFAVNVFGPAEVTRAFLPLLRQGAGRLINVSAPTARVAVPFAAPISASKAALESFSDALRVELAPWNIPVSIVVPGAIESSIFVKAGEASQAAMKSADPQRVALYVPQLEAVARALGAQKSSSPQTVADVILKIVEAKHPSARYIANSDARPFGMISRLPVGLRDRLLTRLLGLNNIPTGEVRKSS
ncbi:MAG TPA: SDR family NAD(P)-dependent oxidoreductase [Galbitalea sp.]|nr:SDR family NAD(P)-dependent oxidoreductase [Galbitalea sp.]